MRWKKLSNVEKLPWPPPMPFDDEKWWFNFWLMTASGRGDPTRGTYTIFVEDSTYYVRSNKTGAIERTATDALDTLQYARDHSPVGSIIMLKEGDFHVSAQFSSATEISLVGSGKATRLIPDGAFDAVDLTNVRVFELVWIDAQGIEHDETFYAFKQEPVPPHAQTHEIDGSDLVRPYQPVSGAWRIVGEAAPFELQADDSLLMYIEGVGYFDSETGKLKVEES